MQADFITLHAAITDSRAGTHPLVGARELSLLKRGAFLVNCARGSLIDETALLAVLNQGHLAGVALDVFSQEPIGESAVLRQLLAHERCPALVPADRGCVARARRCCSNNCME